VNPARPDRTRVRLALNAGEHELSIVLDRAGGKGWGIFARFELSDQEPFLAQCSLLPK